MTWDSQLQAFKESETPKTYDPTIDAWRESNGYVPNPDLGAWEKVWPSRLYLYSPGNKHEDVTGGFKWIFNSGTITETEAYIRLDASSMNGGTNIYATVNKIDLTNYRAMHYTGEGNMLLVNNSRVGGFLRVCPLEGMTNSQEICRLPTGLSTTDVDISDLSGLYHVALSMASMNSAWAKMYELWLE